MILADRARGQRRRRDREADGGAGAGAGLERQLAADQQRALPHAADAEAAVGLVEGEATAVVEDGQLDLLGAVIAFVMAVIAATVAGSRAAT